VIDVPCFLVVVHVSLSWLFVLLTFAQGCNNHLADQVVSMPQGHKLLLVVGQISLGILQELAVEELV
jgi:hypothetical protein